MRNIRSCWEEKKPLCLYKGESQIGKPFGLWVVEGYVKTVEKPSGSIVVWKFLCGGCSKTFEMIPYNILQGKSGGCLKCCMKDFSAQNNPAWKGQGNIPQSIISHAKSGATARGISYSVSSEYLDEVWIQQNGVCALSGETITMKAPGKNRVAWGNYASLDRIDSAIGYEKGNVQWVHPIVNIMKNRFDKETFIVFCHKISRHHERFSNTCL